MLPVTDCLAESWPLPVPGVIVEPRAVPFTWRGVEPGKGIEPLTYALQV